jgi:hypothetical protein
MLLRRKSGLRSLWFKGAAAGDPAEREPLLWLFRDGLHENIEKPRAEAQKLRAS